LSGREIDFDLISLMLMFIEFTPRSPVAITSHAADNAHVFASRHYFTTFSLAFRFISVIDYFSRLQIFGRRFAGASRLTRFTARAAFSPLFHAHRQQHAPLFRTTAAIAPLRRRAAQLASRSTPPALHFA
jgi:hypothetical protein